MTATYVNNLRVAEPADGDSNWGNTTNTSLELIGEALGYGTEAITTNADTHASTVADGSTDQARAMYLKYTGTLDSTCTITIGPNTMKRFQIIENATSGSQSIVISQGSGANVTIGSGAVKAVYLDGAGSGAAVIDAFVDLDLTGTTTVATLTASGVVTGSTLEATADTSAGDNAAMGYTSTEGLILTGQGSTNDITIKNDADADVIEIPTGTTEVNITNALKIIGTTPSITIGDAGEEDTKIVFDGHAQDFYIGLDDSADDLVIGLGSTVGTTPAIAINESQQVTFAQNATFSGSLTSGGAAVKVAGLETIYVPAAAMYPNTTAGCADLAQVELSNGPELKCLDFDASSDENAQFTVIFPKSWNEGTVTFQAFWTVTGTNTGTVAWGLSAGSMADDASINTAFGTNVVATAKAFSGTSNDMTVSATSGAVTIANAAADTMTYFQIMRDVSADDQSGDARLLGIKLFFTTDAANDA